MGISAVSLGTCRAVFFDRDGVLNRTIIRNGKPYPPRDLSELELVPEVHRALELLQETGFVLIGATNQPDVPRGIQRREMVEAINAKIMTTLPLRDILVCYHDDSDDCECRKPKPGLLNQAAALYSIDLVRSFMVGDRWKDVEAGCRAGCRTVLIDNEYAEAWKGCQPDYRAGSLQDAVHWILEQSERSGGNA